MDARNQRETSAHSSAFHEDQLPLFDAYITDELDEDERIQVEQYLQDCQECQQLFAEVTHIRDTLGTLLATGPSSVPVRTRSDSLQMVHAVMASIEQREKREGHLTARGEGQTQTFLRKPGTSVFPVQKRVRPIYLRIGVAVLCLLLLAGLIATLHPSSENGSRSVPPPIVWTTQQPMLVQNSAGVFALKEIEISTTKEFRFYYAFKSSRQGTIHATAFSSLNADQQPVNLHTTVWSLGTIDGISVGVIRVGYLDRVGQTITLNITSQEEGSMSWQLTPLKQLLAEPHPEGGGFYGFYVDQHLFPEIVWSGPSSGLSLHSMVSLFKNAAGTRYIFLQVDYSGKIAVITREQCIQLVGKQACY